MSLGSSWFGGSVLRKADNLICGSDAAADRLWAATTADISWEISDVANGNAYVWLRPRDVRYNGERRQQVQDRMRFRRAALQEDLRRQEEAYERNLQTQLAQDEERRAMEQRQRRHQ